MDSSCRFVVLLHQMPSDAERGDHWDWMLEYDGRLLTWAGDRPPAADLATVVTRLDDHRLAYLDFEGPIDGGRGVVMRVASGGLEWLVAEQGHYCATLQLDESVGNSIWRIELTRISDTRYRLETALWLEA